MRKHKRQKVEKDDANRYIITYADLLTLLLAFFVILYALSEPDETKIEELGFFFQATFTPKVEQISLENPSSLSNERIIRKPLSDGEREMMRSISEQNNLRQVKAQIDEKVEELGLSEHIQTDLRDDGLNVVLTNEVLFDSGSDEIKNADARRLVESIGEIVSDFENSIDIAGHTDDVPMNTEEFPSNWELSSARSMTVLKILSDDAYKIDPERLSASGYGEYNPVKPNDSAANRAKNRRVEIIIKREFPDGLLSTEGSVMD